ncbi:MAG TPA: GNAT family N-acetyltransferase [Myxococcales bacterium]|nr:GNAT family N-acetyltransferase [Myxococcales bacterium]
MAGDHPAHRPRVGAPGREEIALADGTRLVLRPLGPADGAALTTALHHLSPRSRYFRFVGVRREFSPEELRFLLGADGERHVALAAWDGVELAAVARFVICGAGPVAEAAVAVIDRAQRRGIGKLLLERLRTAALERGVTCFTGEVHVENAPMLRLLRKLGGKIGLASLGVCSATLALG